MTDNEIIKALEEYNFQNLDVIKGITIKDILDLINRQKAEVERLQEKSIADDKLLNDRIQEAVNSVSKANQKYVDALEKAFNDKVQELKTAKAEAVKEFAERLNARMRKDIDEQGMLPLPYTKKVYDTVRVFINNLVKEMEEEKC